MGTLRLIHLSIITMLMLCAVHASAQDTGILVVANGETKNRPTEVEINAVVSGEAELAADAIVKYRDAKRRAIEAIEALKLEGLSINSNGFAVNQAVDSQQQMRMMQGMGGDPGKQRVQVTEQIRLVLRGVDQAEPDQLMDTLLKLIDTGRDAGLVIGPPIPSNYYEMQMWAQRGSQRSMINFKLRDPTELRAIAYKQAMDAARTKAQKLAELAGVKLGSIVSVRETPPPTANQQQNQMFAMFGIAPPQMEGEDLSSAVFGEVPVKVTLAVQFEIVK